MKRAAVVLLALSWGSSARADDPVAGRTLFAEGEHLVEEGHYDQACPKFEEGMRVMPGVGMKYNLADCYEHVGRLASAWGAFLDAAAMAHALGRWDEEKVCRRRATGLEPELSRIAIIVSQRADVPGLEVARDGAAIGRGQWATGIPVDGGEHVITATATGRKAWSEKVPVRGDGITVRIEIPLLPVDPQAKVAAPALPAITVVSTERVTTVGKTMRAFGVTGMVSGTVALALGVTFGLLAIDRYAKSNADGHCINAYCDTIGTPLRSDAITFGNVSTTSFVIGGVLGVAGLVLYWFAPTERIAPAWRASVRGVTFAF